MDTRRRGRRFAALLAAACVAACAPVAPRCAADDDLDVYIVARGWHVEVGLAAKRLSGPLAVFRDVFPGARVVMFGYGKRTFFTARADTLSEYVLGPVPGPAAIQVTGLGTLPDEAYEPSAVLTMRLPPDGAAALSAFLWADLDRDAAGGPRLIGPGPYPGSLFYAARSGYSLAHTCNTWAADALHAGGLPVSGSGAALSGQVVGRAVAAGACSPR